MRERDLVRFLMECDKMKRLDDGPAYLFRFHNEQSFFRFAHLGLQHWSGVIIPSIHAFRHRFANPQRLLRQFGELVSLERDDRIQLQFSMSVPAARYALEQSAQTKWPWGIDAVRAREAWRFTKGAGVRIAVIDTGIDPAHPDLRMCMQGGINLYSENVSTNTIFDDNGHGTHIAGTIAASGESGLTGVAPKAEIYSVKAFDRNGTAYISDIIRAIEWCVEHKMHVINMSFGMQERSGALMAAVRSAERRGMLIVASAGNGGNRFVLDEPARYATTLSVGAYNRQGNIASFSKQSAEVDVLAPGEHILSCWLNGGYKHLNGSSMAAAHVSGILALALAIRPKLQMEEVKRIVKASSSNKRVDAIAVIRALFHSV